MPCIWQKTENSDDETTHSLVFKCIGAGNENECQEVLKIAAAESKERKLEVKLRPEPTNEVDKNTIDIHHGSGYFHCGYIASELTKYLHSLIAEDKITDVPVEHIILGLHFGRMGYHPNYW